MLVSAGWAVVAADLRRARRASGARGRAAEPSEELIALVRAAWRPELVGAVSLPSMSAAAATAAEPAAAREALAFDQLEPSERVALARWLIVNLDTVSYFPEKHKEK